MNTCKDCIFWSQDYQGVCSGETGNVSRTRRTYYASSTFNVDKPDGFGVHVDVSDDTGLESYLVTGPDFGCNRFQPKKVEEKV